MRQQSGYFLAKLCIVAATLAFASSASAALLVFTNQAAWEAALVDPTLLEDFQGESLGIELTNYTTANGVNFVATADLFQRPRIVSTGLLGSTRELELIVRETGGTITTNMTLPSSVIALGFDIHDPGNPNPQSPPDFQGDAAFVSILGESFNLGSYIGFLSTDSGFFGVISTAGTFNSALFYNEGLTPIRTDEKPATRAGSSSSRSAGSGLPASTGQTHAKQSQTKQRHRGRLGDAHG